MDLKGTTSDENEETSIVTLFNNLISHSRISIDRLDSSTVLQHPVEQVQDLNDELIKVQSELHKLQSLVENRTNESNDLQNKVNRAKKLLDEKKAVTANALKEKENLAMQLSQIQDIVSKDENTYANLPKEILDKLSQYEAINSTTSVTSDFSLRCTDDSLNVLHARISSPWKRHRASSEGVHESPGKKLCSSFNRVDETEVAAPVLTSTMIEEKVTDSGIPAFFSRPINLQDLFVAEDNPKASNNQTFPFLQPYLHNDELDSTLHFKKHSFQKITLVMPKTCKVCEQRIKFAGTAYKCTECKNICHEECKKELALPCRPKLNIATQINSFGTIENFVATTPPMIPAALISCVNEIESRGLTEPGLYTVPGSNRDIKALTTKLFKGKKTPSLNNIEIRTICDAVQNFFGNLDEPLVTYGLWKDLVQALEGDIYQIIPKLPQPNRDTLAFMILHLQKISDAKCSNGVNQLARIFGPVIVGYSTGDLKEADLSETVKAIKVMENLIMIPSDYWSSFIYNVANPSTANSLCLPRTGLPSILFDERNVELLNRKQKFFPSPKYY